jgi:hypothetical protein
MILEIILLITVSIVFYIIGFFDGAEKVKDAMKMWKEQSELTDRSIELTNLVLARWKETLNTLRGMEYSISVKKLKNKKLNNKK